MIIPVLQNCEKASKVFWKDIVCTRLTKKVWELYASFSFPTAISDRYAAGKIEEKQEIKDFFHYVTVI